MTNYRKAKRPDLAILDVLSKSIDPMRVVDIHKGVCPDADWVSIAAISQWAQQMVTAGLITRSTHPRGGSVPVYGITCSGRARLVVEDTHSIFHDHLKDTPLHATVCHRPEVPEVTEESEPAVALLCVDEDELDTWWNALDVEAKADAFVQWSLGNDGRNSHVYIEPHETTSIPIVGTAGETAEEWNAKAERLNKDRARVEAAPEDPMPMDLLCMACGERGGKWTRGEQPQFLPATNLSPGKRCAMSNDGSGLYIYTHHCQEAATA